MTPLQYLKLFWDENILEHIAHHTNLYSVQQNRKLRCFFGIQMTMAIVKMPQYKMYWSPEFRYERVAVVIRLKRYETLRKFLHVNDNVSRNNLENSNDKLFKVRALLDLVTNNSKKIGPEKTHSIDEQIIPAKTKRSGGVKQYNPKKNSLVGFQEFGLLLKCATFRKLNALCSHALWSHKCKKHLGNKHALERSIYVCG